MKAVKYLVMVSLLLTGMNLQGQNSGGQTCATATDIGLPGGPNTCPGGSGFVGESTSDAELTLQNPSCDQIGSNYDLWYSFTAPTSGGVQVELDLGTAVRIEGAVYSDCQTEVFCNSSNMDGAMIMNLTPGETYYLQLWSDGFARGTFDFCLFAKDGPPINDQCTDPVALTIRNGSNPCDNVGRGDLYNNFGATASGTLPFPSCGSFGMGMDVWYVVTIPASGDLDIEMTEAIGPQDWAMAAYIGDCSSLTELACDDDSGDMLKPKLSLIGRTPGETILLRVWEIGGNGFGSYRLLTSESSNAAPPNNLCTGAIDITALINNSGGCTPICGHNVNSTPSGETPNPSCGNLGLGKDVWFKAIVPNAGGFNVELNSFTTVGPQDWAMAAYTGNCGGLSIIACDDDSGMKLYPRISITGRTPGETIYFRIWEFGGDEEGSFNICITPLAPLAIVPMNFSVNKMSEANKLTWDIAANLNWGSMDLMTSVEGGAWTKLIGYTEEKGTTSFEYMHKNYERIQMYQVWLTLEDTRNIESQILTVERNEVQSGKLLIMPIPADEFIDLVWTGSQEENLETDRIAIYDMQGNLVSLKIQDWTRLNEQSIRVRIDHLAPGSYVLRMNAGGKNVISKFVKK